MLTTAISDNDL